MKKENTTDIARAAICSIGSFDRGLQDHYQKRLDNAIAFEPYASEARYTNALRPVVSHIFDRFDSLSRGQALQMVVDALLRTEREAPHAGGTASAALEKAARAAARLDLEPDGPQPSDPEAAALWWMDRFTDMKALAVQLTYELSAASSARLAIGECTLEFRQHLEGKTGVAFIEGWNALASSAAPAAGVSRDELIEVLRAFYASTVSGGMGSAGHYADKIIALLGTPSSAPAMTDEERYKRFGTLLPLGERPKETDAELSVPPAAGLTVDPVAMQIADDRIRQWDSGSRIASTPTCTGDEWRLAMALKASARSATAPTKCADCARLVTVHTERDPALDVVGEPRNVLAPPDSEAKNS